METGDGLAAEAIVWKGHEPTHVVAYNLAFAPSIQKAFWRRVCSEASVRCVAVWRPLPAEVTDFGLLCTLRTTTPVDEAYTAYIYRRGAQDL